MSDHSHIFTSIYESCKWGNNNNNLYSGSSGGGSSIEYNKDTYIPFIKKFIKDKQIKSIVDLGCGDWTIGNLIYNDIEIIYTGYDVYNKLIEHNKKMYQQFNFIALDFYTEKHNILSADMCILKDVLQHWSTEEIYNFLDYIIDSKKFKYILICNCMSQLNDNHNITTGETR